MHRLTTIAAAMLLLAAGVAAQERNPALLELPSFDDAELRSDQSRLLAVHEAWDASVLDADSSVCELGEDVRWLIAQQMSRAEYERSMEVLPEHMRPSIDRLDVQLVDGECEDGTPVGPFVAVALFETSQRIGTTENQMRDHRLVHGTMTDGRLDGEVLRSGRADARSSSAGLLYSNVLHAITRFDATGPTGQAMIMAWISGTEDLQQIATHVTDYSAPGRGSSRTWMGNMLATETTLERGVTHGWVLSHPIEAILGQRTPRTRVCFQYGRPAPDAACDPDRIPADTVSMYERPTMLTDEEQLMLDAAIEAELGMLPGSQRDFAATESLCPLDDDILWALGYGHGAARVRDSGAVLRIEGKVVEGECVDGALHGPFETLVEVEVPASRGSGTEVIVSRSRGELAHGMRQGLWRSARTRYDAFGETISFAAAAYEDDRLVGPRINLMDHHTFIERPPDADGASDNVRFVGTRRAESYRTVDGIRHGTSTTYQPGRDPVQRCYQHGRIVSNRACD